MNIRDMTIADMVGRTFVTVEQFDDERLLFTSNDGLRFDFFHDQSCCECVEIEDVCGDLRDLVASPLIQADEESGEIEDAYESGTWTFYKFATNRGSVTVRWTGYSNGCYSEAVDLHVYEVVAGA